MEEDHLGLAVGSVGEFEGLDDGLVVVAVRLYDFPAKCGPFVPEVSYSADCLYGAVYLLAVPVREGHKVIKLMVGGPHAGLPYLAFLALSVSEEAEDALRLIVHLFAKRYACSAGKALAEGTGGLMHTGEVV